jgi:putative ABC transport system substrate-binding protein
MSEKLNSAIAVIGIDIGKNSFHLVGHDRRGAIVLRQKWSRGQVEVRLANLSPCLIGMEARGIELEMFSAGTSAQIASAMNDAKTWGAAALNVLAAPLFSFNRRLVILRATALRLPAIYEWPEMAEEGGLLAYGARLPQVYRQAGRLLVKVLRGVKPTDIPAEQPTRFELVINLQAAKAIDHEVPAGLVLRVDKVVE